MSGPRAVTAADVAAWADVADDHNPLHLDAGFAATTRFGRPVVHGSLLFSLVCDALQEAEGDWAARGAVRVRFRAPVPVGEQVEVDVAAGSAHLRSGGGEPVEITVSSDEEQS